MLTVDEDALSAEVRELMPAWLQALEPASAWAERLRPAFEEMYRRCAATDVGFTRWTGQQKRSWVMPYIEVKAFDRRIDDASAAARRPRLTDGLCSALGEEVREATWVVVEGVPPSSAGGSAARCRRESSRLLSTSLTAGRSAVPAVVGAQASTSSLPTAAG